MDQDLLGRRRGETLKGSVVKHFKAGLNGAARLSLAAIKAGYHPDSDSSEDEATGGLWQLNSSSNESPLFMQRALATGTAKRPLTIHANADI